jgi:thioredoxin 1
VRLKLEDLLDHSGGLQPAVFFAKPLAKKESMNVPAIVDEETFLEAMSKSEGDKIVAIKFHASWCRACKSIAPRFKCLAKEFGGEAAFYQIEFSANKDLCRRLDIKKLPCVQFFQGAEGNVATVLCGPSKFPDVRLKLEDLLDHSHHAEDVPEFTDVSQHYDTLT